MLRAIWRGFDDQEDDRSVRFFPGRLYNTLYPFIALYNRNVRIKECFSSVGETSRRGLLFAGTKIIVALEILLLVHLHYLSLARREKRKESPAPMVPLFPLSAI